MTDESKAAAAAPAKEEKMAQATVTPVTPTANQEELFAKMKQEFDTRTKALGEKLKEQEQVIKFNECLDTIVYFIEKGKITPASESFIPRKLSPGFAFDRRWMI